MKTTHTSRPVLGGILATLVASTALAQSDYSTAVQALNPVAYWRLNETAAAPAQNKVVNASTLGSVLDGLVISNAEKGQPGIVNNGLRLNNPGVVVAYCGSKIDVPFNPALNKRGPFSIELWLKPNELGSDANGMAVMSSISGDFAASNRSGYLIYVNNAGRIQFRMGNTAGYVGNTDNGSKPALNVVKGQWSHVVCVYDGAQTYVYINGEVGGTKVLTAAEINAIAPNFQMPFRLGGTGFNGSITDYPASSAGGVSGNRGFDGWVDEVAHYSYGLTADQVKAHFTAASANPTGYKTLILSDNPTGYWPLDDAAVTPPDPATLPTVKNSGSAGAEADGLVEWGGLTGQAGPGYAGLGADNKALDLDGANGYVSVGTSAGLDIKGDITLAAWIKPTAKNFYRDIIARGWDGKNAEVFLRLSRSDANAGYGNTNNYEIGVTDGANYYDSVVVPMPQGDLGNWVFLAGTYGNGKWTLYRNGQEIGSLESANGAIVTENGWAIGAQADAVTGGAFEVIGGLSTYFQGGIDEPAIWNRALTSAEVLQLYLAAKVSPVITRSISSPTGYLGAVWPTLYKGDSITLNVVADGTEPLTYSWSVDGKPLSETGPSLKLTDLQAGTPTYSVTVTNPNGSTTDSVKLDIKVAKPIVTKQPLSVARFDGGSFTLSVETGGTKPQTYQWQLNGVNIEGATTATYTTTATVANNGASYTCVASNEAGSAPSAAAVLTVLAAPKQYPAAVIASSPIAYWRLNETAGTTAYDYAGYNNGVYSKVTLGQEGYSPLDGDRAALFSGENSYVGQLSGTAINFQGTNVSFTIECWAKAPEGLADETSLVAKGTGADGTTANEQFALDVVNGKYRLMTRGNNNSVYSAEAEVGPNGTWQHIVGVYDQTVSEAPQIRIYVDGQLSGSGSGRPAENGGLRASTSPVSIGSKRLGNSPAYNATFNGLIDEVAIYGTALTEETILAHYASIYGNNTAPKISIQPTSVTNYTTLNATLAVNAYGSIPLAYQWQKNGVDIAGATSARYTITGLTPADAANYTVKVSNGAGAVTSDTARLLVLPAPSTPPNIPGLVLHLPFDGSLIDATGRGNNGTAIRQTSTSSNITVAGFLDGKIGLSLDYKSDFGEPSPTAGVTTTTNTTYVTLGVRPDLQFGSNVNFTIAFWIKLPQDYIGGDLPFFCTAQNANFNPGISLAPAYGYGIGSGSEPDPAPVNYGGWAVTLFDKNSAGAGYYGEVSSINDGGWHHLAYVFDRKSQVAVYLDGSLAKAFKQSGTSTAAAQDIDTGLPATIGQDPSGLYQESGAGNIDDLGIWRRALTPLEVGAIFTAGMNKVSFVGTAVDPTITINGSVITYDGGVLQESATLAGPYGDIPGAASPYTVPADTGAKFYRVKQ